jgi:hypothetical protein
LPGSGIVTVGLPAIVTGYNRRGIRRHRNHRMTAQARFSAAPVHWLSPHISRVGVDRMLRIQGYAAPERVRPIVREAAERNAVRAEGLFDPAVCYRRIPVVSCNDGTLTLPGDIRLHCGAFTRFLSAAREVAVFVTTAGARIDDELARLHGEQELLDMLFLETAAWLGVEAITKAFIGHLRSRAAEDALGLTRRMGPGYSYKSDGVNADWRLEEQQALFSLFGEATLPVQLLESCAMLPKMSRSGLVGLAPLVGAHPR